MNKNCNWDGMSSIAWSTHQIPWRLQLKMNTNDKMSRAHSLSLTNMTNDWAHISCAEAEVHLRSRTLTKLWWDRAQSFFGLPEWQFSGQKPLDTSFHQCLTEMGSEQNNAEAQSLQDSETCIHT